MSIQEQLEIQDEAPPPDLGMVVLELCYQIAMLQQMQVEPPEEIVFPIDNWKVSAFPEKQCIVLSCGKRQSIIDAHAYTSLVQSISHLITLVEDSS